MSETTENQVKLGQYRGLTYRRHDVDIHPWEIDSHIRQVMEGYSETVNVTDRPVAAGDTAIIDFEGFRDGVAFEGGKGTNYGLEIGSHSFIDNFEDQLIGAMPGSHVEVHVRFPEQYHAAELAGVPVVFQVDVHSIQEHRVPELTEEFVKENFGAESIEEYRKNLEKKLLLEKRVQIEDVRRQALIARAVDGAEVEIPESELRMEIMQSLQTIDMNMRQQGMTLEQYLQMTGMTQEALEQQIRPQAEQSIRARMVLAAIAEAEELEAEEEEVERQIAQMAETYHMPVEQMKKMLEGNIELIRSDLLMQKAVQIIMDNAIATEE